MGVILKENNLIYTKKRHEKFLGSSCYKYDKAKNRIYKKEKVTPIIPIVENGEINDYDRDFLQSRIQYYGEDHALCSFQETPVILEKQKRPKKTEYKLNKKKVREKCSAFFGLKQSKKFLAFYSISFPQGFPDELGYKCMNTVLTRLRKNCGLKSYMRITERQKNGTIHFHMLTNNFMYIRRFNYYMAKAIETQINSKKNKGKVNINFDVNKYNGVDVRHVNNNRKALNSYLTKYVSKNDIIFYRLPYHSSRDISELFTAETFANTQCSDFQYICKTIKHIQTFIVDNDWCTIEYLNQKQDNGKWFTPPDEWYWLRDYLNEEIYKNHHSKVRFNVLALS